MGEPEPVDEAPKAEVRGGNRPGDYIPSTGWDFEIGLDDEEDDEPA